MEDPEARQPSEARAASGASEISPVITDLFGEQVYEGCSDRKSKKRAARQRPRSSGNWLEPEPIATEFGPTQAYPAECLTNLQPMLEVINEKNRSRFSRSAASVLPSVALLAQSDYRTLTLGTEAPLGIYMMGLVSSGGRKTTAHHMSFKAHIDADELALARYEAMLDAHRDRSSWENIGEGLLRIPRGVPPNALHTDMTKAALIKALGHGRLAQCLASSDAGVVMGNWSSRGAQATETFQTLTSLWDGHSHTRTRVNMGFRLSGRTLSIAWLAQPAFGRWLFSQNGELGLSGRFLVDSDDHWKAPRLTDEEIDVLVAAEAANQGTPPVDPVLQRFWDIIAAGREVQDEAMEFLPASNGPTVEPSKLIGRTPDTHRFLRHYGRDTGHRAEGQDNPHVQGFWRRAPEQACRLAAVIVAWGRYEAEAFGQTGTARPIPTASVDEGTAQRASTLIDWYGVSRRASLTRRDTPQ